MLGMRVVSPESKQCILNYHTNLPAIWHCIDFEPREKYVTFVFFPEKRFKLDVNGQGELHTLFCSHPQCFPVG